MQDPPRANRGEGPVAEPDDDQAESPPAARPTRGTPAVVWPTLAETLVTIVSIFFGHKFFWNFLELQLFQLGLFRMIL